MDSRIPWFLGGVIATALGEVRDQVECFTGPVWEKADYMDLGPCSRRVDQALS